MGGSARHSKYSLVQRRTHKERAHVAESGRRDRRFADAPREGGTRRAGGLQIGGRLRPVPAQRERGRRRLDSDGPACRGLPGRGPAGHPGRHPVGVRVPAGPRGREDGAALRPLRRAAAAGRGGLGHAAVRADRARRPLVRAGHRGLQGRCADAPAGAARAEGERRRAGARQGDRRGVRGAGHGRPGAVRRGAPRAAGRRHHRHRRRGQLPGRPADGHLQRCAA